MKTLNTTAAIVWISAITSAFATPALAEVYAKQSLLKFDKKDVLEHDRLTLKRILR